MKRSVFNIMALFAAVGLMACETTKGVGRDISHAGQVVTEAAEEAEG